MPIDTPLAEEIWNAKNVQLFEGLPEIDIEEMLAIMPNSLHRPGEYIFHTGEIADCIYILQTGMVKVSYITLDGNEKILNVFREGDVFGELFLGQYRHRIGEAQALEDTTVAHLYENDFLELTQRFPRLALNLIRHLTDQQRRIFARMHALSRMEARHRLMGILLNIARRYCCDYGDWFTVPGNLRQEDIANMACLNRSTVSTLINTLREEGVLGGSGRTLTVNRPMVESILEEAGFDVLE
jgi:CRP/FNR family transcriptional regulator